MFARKTTTILAASLALLASACDSEPAGLSDPPLKSFLLTSTESVQIEPGDQVAVTATKNGVAATGVTWTTGNAAVATVSATGVITAVGAGKSYVTATLGGESRHVAVDVPTLQGTALVKGVAVSLPAGTAGSIVIYRLFVPTGSTNVTFTSSGGTGDADMYIRQGSPATINTTTGASTNAACISGGATTAETCSVTNPARGSWYVSMLGFTAYSGTSLTGTYTP